MENETILCCCCCQSGPIKLKVSIDRCGYCPGEKIAIDAECQNLTSRRLGCIRVLLTRHVEWKAKGKQIGYLNYELSKLDLQIC